jgi:hypothetical protein
VKGIKAGSIGDSESQMMQPDVSASIERDCFTGRLDLPQCQDAVAIGYEHRWIIRPLADNAPSKAIAKEPSRAHEVANAQPDVVDTACAGLEFVCHQYPPIKYRTVEASCQACWPKIRFRRVLKVPGLGIFLGQIVSSLHLVLVPGNSAART